MSQAQHTNAASETSEAKNNWIEDLFLDGINKAMNKSLSYDLESTKKLEAFEGKVIKVELQSTPFEFYIKISDKSIVLAKHLADKADTTIKGTPLALFSMNAEEPIIGIKSVQIQGDANTGQFFAKWLKNLKPDWEEACCELLGDGMGVRVSSMAKGLLDFGKNIKDSLLKNSSEYLQEESRDLISPSEMEDFLDDVDDLKADTARLEQQIQQLKA